MIQKINDDEKKRVANMTINVIIDKRAEQRQEEKKQQQEEKKIHEWIRFKVQ